MTPIYTYLCPECKITSEKLVKGFKSRAPRCETCKGKTKRVPSRVGGFIFKGKGFYCNDYPKG